MSDSYTCPNCGRTSYNPNDVRESYCGFCHEYEESEKPEVHNIYRDGKIHLLNEMCSTCIFNPKTRPVDGQRVAGMVRDTMDDDGATVVCHSTLMTEPQENAICRGWYDRLGKRDSILALALEVGAIKEVPVPPKV